MESEDRDFQKKYLVHIDESRATLVGKHEREILSLREKHLTEEAQWEREKKQLLDTIESLKNTISQQKLGIDNFNENQNQDKASSDSLNDVAVLRKQNSELDATVKNQLVEITRFRGVERQNQSTFQELVAARQKIKELEFRLRNLETARNGELEEALESLHSSDRVRSTVERNLHALQSKFKELSAANGDLSAELTRSKDENSQLRGELNQLRQTSSAAAKQRPRCSSAVADKSGPTFRDFVQMQREVVSLRDQNEKLLRKLTLLSPKSSALTQCRPK